MLQFLPCPPLSDPGGLALRFGPFEYYDAHARTSKPSKPSGRQRSDMAGLACPTPHPQPLGLFWRGRRKFRQLDTDLESSGQTPGYTFNTAGTTFGSDYRLNDALTLVAPAGISEAMPCPI